MLGVPGGSLYYKVPGGEPVLGVPGGSLYYKVPGGEPVL